MMVEDPKLPYFLKGNDGAPLLLYLHGVGEGFRNQDVSSFKNLEKQGPPKHYERLAKEHRNHPLVTEFKAIAPQLPDRETPWSAMIADLERLVAAHRVADTALYVMGFSKGGRAALEVAAALGANSVVIIDAAPMQKDVKASADSAMAANKARPFWAIHAVYPASERNYPIQRFNEQLAAARHDGLETSPTAGRQWRTVLHDETIPVEKRHGWVCDQATTAESPYRWLLQH